jgi:hypothetical protein
MSATPPDDEQSPWSRPAVLLSGAFILALIIVGVIVAVTSGGGSHKTHTVAQQPPTSTTTSASTASSSTTSSSTSCSLPAGSQSIPSASPPAGTQWATVGSMQVPQAPQTYGPERASGAFNTCFAHSPSGALLAAINLWGEGTAASPSSVMKKLAVGAPQNLGNGDRLDAGGSIQLAGYKFGSYSPRGTSISVVLKGPKGALLSVVTSMVWNGTDWKYKFPAKGDPSFQLVQDLTGYVEWSDF